MPRDKRRRGLYMSVREIVLEPQTTFNPSQLASAAIPPDRLEHELEEQFAAILGEVTQRNQ